MYSHTNKYPCTDCDVYWLNIQLRAKKGIEIYRYQKFGYQQAHCFV